MRFYCIYLWLTLVLLPGESIWGEGHWARTAYSIHCCGYYTRTFRCTWWSEKKTKQSIFFGSQLSISKKTKKFYEFEPNKWIKKEDLAKLDHVEKNYNKILKLFLNTKYLWGGKSVNGIDCSALIQILILND